MQWSSETNAGFTDGEPWIPVNPNKDEVNVETAREDPGSVWHYYRDLIDLRHRADVLVYGSYDLLLPDHEDLWVYTRTLTDDAGVVTARTLTVLNGRGEETAFEPPASVADEGAELLIANYDVDDQGVSAGTLRPWEARVYRLV
jgi:glycosidase